jgi:hypothetical protein
MFVTTTLSPVGVDLLASEMARCELAFQEARSGLNAVAAKSAGSPEYLQAVQLYADSYSQRDEQMVRVRQIVDAFGFYSAEDRAQMLVGENFVLLTKEHSVRVLPCAQQSH